MALNTMKTSGILTFMNKLDHFLARMSVNRSGHKVIPGLYSIGNPTDESPVFVTANYTLSFDELRSALTETDGYILVLDTKGVNVWCAAGKGTFGTDELIEKINSTGLKEIIKHRKLIAPQLGATGICAFEVKKKTGFDINFGPIRADDIKEYLKTGKATGEMRQIRFNLADRIVLIPVELIPAIIPMIISATAVYFILGFTQALAVIVAFFAGLVLFPILFPWIPTRDFSSKGVLLGVLFILPFVVYTFSPQLGPEFWKRMCYSAGYLLAMPPITGFFALNFTGATPFASKTGVRREMSVYLPIMGMMLALGILMFLLAKFL